MALGAGAVAATLPDAEVTIPIALQILIVVVPAAVLLRSALLLRLDLSKGLGPSRLSSAIFASGALLAIALPGAELLAGLRRSILVVLGYGGLSPVHDVSAAYALTLLALLSCVIGEELAIHWWPVVGPSPWRAGRRLARLDSRLTFWVLLGFGALGLLLLPRGSDQVAFSSRGQATGQGIFVTLQYCLPLAVSIGILASHWRSRVLPLISAGATALAVYWTGARTPLLIIGAAVMVRILIQYGVTRHSLRYVLAMSAAVYIGAVLLVGISSWRGLTIQGLQPSIVEQVYLALPNPFGQLTNAGLDTLDGMTLSMAINPDTVGASWTDPFKAVTNLIPSQLWPSKPEWLGAIVTHRFLNFGGGAGIFLSGPGYLFLVFGGPLGTAAGFLVIGFGSARLLTRLRTPAILVALVAYLLFRFFVGGDAFDVFNTLTLLIALVAAGAIASLLSYAAMLPSGGHSALEPRTVARAPDRIGSEGFASRLTAGSDVTRKML